MNAVACPPTATCPTYLLLGYQLSEVSDSHICCGSAGTYSLLQPELSNQLRRNKLEHLQANKPDAIATANIGCHSHLLKGSQVPIVHWIELLQPDDAWVFNYAKIWLTPSRQVN